jgi:hypothetical protein
MVMALVMCLPMVQAQSSFNGSIGIGGGLSYGGLGAQINYHPIEKMSVFGGLGYNLNALGYNLGLQLHVISPKRLNPYITAMYGYNTVLLVDAITMESKTTYFGFSTGVGVEFKLKDKSFLSAEILLPFRPQAYKKAVDDLQSIGYEIKDPMPVTFSIGYHIRF